MIIEGKNAILGRLCSYATKQALLGKEIAIVNCNEVVILGSRENILEKYSIMRKKDSSNLKGPFFPKVPEKIVKRVIRGMLSYKQERGEKALDRIMCYNKVPAELENAKKIHLESFSNESKRAKMVKLNEVARLI